MSQLKQLPYLGVIAEPQSYINIIYLLLALAAGPKVAVCDGNKGPLVTSQHTDASTVRATGYQCEVRRSIGRTI